MLHDTEAEMVDSLNLFQEVNMDRGGLERFHFMLIEPLHMTLNERPEFFFQLRLLVVYPCRLLPVTGGKRRQRFMEQPGCIVKKSNDLLFALTGKRDRAVCHFPGQHGEAL